MNGLPVIGGDFVELVMKMRAAQDTFFKSHHTRDLQRAQQLERLVDAKALGWFNDMQKWEKWSASVKTDELPGVYDVASKESMDDEKAT